MVTSRNTVSDKTGKGRGGERRGRSSMLLTRTPIRIGRLGRGRFFLLFGFGGDRNQSLPVPRLDFRKVKRVNFGIGLTKGVRGFGNLDDFNEGLRLNIGHRRGRGNIRRVGLGPTFLNKRMEDRGFLLVLTLNDTINRGSG